MIIRRLRNSIHLLVLLVLLGLVLWLWLRGPVAHSDVPVISELGWAPYQDDLTITEVTAEAVKPDLGLSIWYDRSHFLMRIRIKGVLRDDYFHEHVRLRIAKLQLTGRVISRATAASDYESTADVLLVPVVAPDQDKKYEGDGVPFDLSVEHVFSTMDWGKNTYQVHCGDKVASVTVSMTK